MTVHKNNFYCSLRTGIILGVGLLLLVGCGVKAPPVPPGEKPPLLKQLAHTIENGTLVLTWRLATGSPAAKHYTLYRSKEPVSEKACKGCPLVFRRLMHIPTNSQKNGARSLKLEKGFRYGFKVTATTASGLEGPASNTVKFNYN